MDSLLAGFDAFKTWFDGLAIYYKFILGGLALYLPVRRYLWPSWRLLRLALYHGQPLARSRALAELCVCLFYVQKTHSLWRAARLRVELELFKPRPARPLPCSVFKTRVGNWCHHCRAVLAWRRELSVLLLHLAEDAKEGVAQIKVGTCFEVHEVRERLACYFESLAFVAPAHAKDTDRCLAHVRIEQGFVAPLYLLTGLLDRFGEDWQPVIDEFGHAITQKNDRLNDRGLRRLQTFLFDCWLLWGPSVPVCNCDYWHGVNALQYGYGDENNSLPLYGEKLADALAGLIKRVQSDPQPPVAFQASVLGIPRWGPRQAGKHFCIAQQAICNPGANLLLEFVRLDEIGSREQEVRRRYYSAYIWVMFLICDVDGMPLYPDEPWRDLLPFYEHGNIADGRTYAFMKRQLVRKAIGSLGDLSRQHPKLCFRYVCAFDETLCGGELRYSTPEPALHKLLLESAQSIDDDGFKRGVQLDTPAGWQDSNYSACHLPSLITQYYEHVRREQ